MLIALAIVCVCLSSWIWQPGVQCVSLRWSSGFSLMMNNMTMSKVMKNAVGPLGLYLSLSVKVTCHLVKAAVCVGNTN